MARIRRALRTGDRSRGPADLERGELVAGTDPEQLAFELDALGTAVNSGWQLHENAAVFDRGRRAIARKLEADTTATGRAALAAA